VEDRRGINNDGRDAADQMEAQERKRRVQHGSYKYERGRIRTKVKEKKRMRRRTARRIHDLQATTDANEHSMGGRPARKDLPITSP